ncbi:MAG: NUDIX domain-containing protein [Verrucomicrobia bacterium]|jgi:isopentenyl-diphosphate delta-isomerase type 1|nr:NUDIX domain-containing protein [Verrucomicrobiota bacterium]
MNEELFEVVNERDEVIDTLPRAEVHARGLLHRAVHVLAFNQAGQLFLQKRSMLKDCFPGVWDSSASGHLAPGETYDTCAVRELREELGITPEHPLEPLFKIDACSRTGQEFVWIYRFQSEGPFHLAPDEVECGDWFHPQEITEWIARAPGDFADAFPLVWERMKQSGHR